MVFLERNFIPFLLLIVLPLIQFLHESSIFAESKVVNFVRLSNQLNRRRSSRPTQPRRNQRKHHPFFDKHRTGAKEHAIINGEYYETNRILMQKITRLGVGYFAYGEPKLPIFIRKEREQNKKTILFQDPYLPPGEGYIVVLKRIPMKLGNLPVMLQRMIPDGADNRQGEYPIPAPKEVAYEAFRLLLSNNIHGAVDIMNVKRFAYRIRTRFFSRKHGRWKFAQRRKAMSHQRRRFSITRWRGKRSVGSQFWNSSEVHIALGKEVKITCMGGGSKLSPYKVTPLNVSQVRLRLMQMTKSVMKDKAIKFDANTTLNELGNFDFVDY